MENWSFQGLHDHVWKSVWPSYYNTTATGPGKLLMIGVWEIDQNRPQMHKFLGLHYSLRCSLSANTGSIDYRPQRARPSKLTVVGCLCAHECLTSETFPFNLQSNDGSRYPHHKVPWISGPQCLLTTSLLASPLWTLRTCQVFSSIRHHTAFSIR